MLIGVSIVVVLIGIVLIAAYLTNPFNAWHIIRRPYIVIPGKQAWTVQDTMNRMVVRQGTGWRLFALVKCGLQILSSRYVGRPHASAKTVSGIIAEIHERRFDPRRLLLISGDHFSSLYPRNLGVFYYSMLDTRIPSSASDWHNRQVTYLQTSAYALAVFSEYTVPATTIVATGPYSATCINFYSYPSDTVYGLLYGLAALTDKQLPAPFKYGHAKLKLQTVELANKLLDEQRLTLRTLYEHYKNTVYNPTTGLIHTSIHVSGAKDISRRSSAFYDNVIFWKTTQLSMQLGIIPKRQAYLDAMKKRIIKKFWLDSEGYFLEDLSEEGVIGKYYSSDWLIVLATGFLDPMKARERQYFERSVSYIRQHDIDEPFAIKYQQDTRAHRQFLPVRIAVASYGGDAIWSFWGMEYIKVLLRLYQATSNRQYLRLADGHINAYKRTMLRDKGFPEVYDPNGKLLQTPLYKSIRETGWVIGFEQVLSIRKSIAK